MVHNVCVCGVCVCGGGVCVVWCVWCGIHEGERESDNRDYLVLGGRIFILPLLDLPLLAIL